MSDNKNHIKIDYEDDFMGATNNAPVKKVSNWIYSNDNNSETNSESEEDNSDDNLNYEDEQDNVLTEIDKKIIIKYMKEIKTSRTYIHGLESYVKLEDIPIFIKTLQKSLGTSSLKKQDDDDNNIYGFAGEHIDKIYDYIIKKKICSKKDVIKQ